MQSYTPRFLWKSPSTMASNPITPGPHSNGNGLHDPFTDERKGTHSSTDSKGKDKGSGKREGNGEETPTLFYAYARRVGCSHRSSSPYTLSLSTPLFALLCKLGPLEVPTKHSRNSQTIIGPPGTS